MGVFLSLTIRMCPEVFDVTLAQFDDTLGFQPSAAAVRLLDACKPLRCLCVLVYLLLPIGMALPASAEIRSGNPQGLGVLPTSLVAGAIGFCLYLYVPAVGPGPFFGSNLALVLDPTVEASGSGIGDVPRNCMPSLHVTWATLAFLATRRRAAWVRVASGGFLLLTVLATLGLARHYLVDLVVAAPFVLFVRGLCAVRTAWGWQRCTAVALGLCLVLGWTTAIRAGAPSVWEQTALPAAMGLTVLAAIGAEGRLALAEQAGQGRVRPCPGVVQATSASPASRRGACLAGRRLRSETIRAAVSPFSTLLYARLISTRARLTTDTAQQPVRSDATP